MSESAAEFPPEGGAGEQDAMAAEWEAALAQQGKLVGLFVGWGCQGRWLRGRLPVLGGHAVLLKACVGW